MKNLHCWTETYIGETAKAHLKEGALKWFQYTKEFKAEFELVL